MRTHVRPRLDDCATAAYSPFRAHFHRPRGVTPRQSQLSFTLISGLEPITTAHACLLARSAFLNDPFAR